MSPPQEPEAEFCYLKPTPAVPPELLNIEQLAPNAETLLRKRYLRKGEDGQAVEEIPQMFWRVSWHVAEPEPEEERQMVATHFYRLLTTRKFFPNSPTFTGAGIKGGNLAACYVLRIRDDMGKEEDGIFRTLSNAAKIHESREVTAYDSSEDLNDGIFGTLNNAALVQQLGGGNGFDFSELREKGAFIRSSGGRSSGPIGFLKVYDRAFGMIAQGGTRRGANMAVLRVDHPDIRRFITCKAKGENAVTNFNISVALTDEFMRAVKTNQNYKLVSPQTRKVVEEVSAREIWDLIVANAHSNGEPGVLFIDTANRANPVPHLYWLQATNPCGEQWLGPNENCCLGSINLSMYVIDGVIDWEGLKRDVGLAVRFLDDVIDANEYVPSLPQLKRAAQNCRRIGLGIMGLGDVMYMCGIRYGSPRAQEFASQIMEWVRFWAMSVSVELAKTRGPFPAIRESIYDPKGCPKMVERFGHEFPGRGERTMWWEPPTPLVPHKTDFGRPKVNWSKLKFDILKWGIRNAAQTTVAPTGTIASVASCESYGCEPVFALAYVRHVNDNGKDLALNYVSPLFMQALQKAGLDEAAQQRVITRVLSEGTCQALAEDLPPNIINTFVVSMDITAEEHVAMQAAIQAFVDNSMSKTCNFAEGTSKEEVSKAYFDAWEKGCKGLTVYVAGSRTKVVLETNAEAKRKEEQKNEIAEESPKAKNKELEGKAKSEMAIKHILHGGSMDSDPSDDSDDGSSSSSGPRMVPIKKSCDCNKKAIGMRRQRPKRLRGETSSVMTPIGNAFVTINEDSNGYPFETFISVGKTGSVISSLSQPLARLASACLRIVEPEESWLALEIIISQLDGIKDGRSVGFGENKVHSLPDGVAKILKEYVINKTTRVNSKELTAFIDLKKTTDGEEQQHTETKKPAIVLPPGVEADICRECGECAVVEQEGCSRCYSCLVGTC